MKLVFSSPDSSQVGLLKSMLDEAGIPCLIRNEAVSRAIPIALFQPELCVMNDEDYPRAHDLCERWRHPSSTVPASWICPKCGEKIEGQFSSCWNCGAEQVATV